MFKKIMLAQCITASFFLSVALAQESTTSWLGTLDAGSKRLRIEINITERDGELTGQARSIDQNNTWLQMADIKLDDASFGFTLPDPGAKFSGSLSDDGRTATGTFSQGRGEIPLTLRRQDAQTAAQSEAPVSFDDRLQELSQTVEWYVEKDRVVGAELQIIQDGKSIYHKSFGKKDRKEDQSWTNDTICNIRSMTKPITSVAAQILIDKGLLELEKPVANYLSSFDNEKSRTITVRQVLTHRSGLPLTNLVGPFQYKSLSGQVAAAGEKGPDHEPGSKFWYSDTGTDVVGALVEKVTGESLDKFVQREILKPLGMTNTFYGIDGDDERFGEVASLYVKGYKGWFRFWTPKKPLYPFAWGSQTLYSTTTDYARFLRMMMNHGRVGDRQLLSTKAVERMLAPVSEMKMLGSDAAYPTGFRGLKAYYGQMMVTHRDIDNKDAKPVVIGHSGSDGTNAWAWPDRDLIVLYFTQSRGGATALRIEKPIDRLLVHAGQWKEEVVPADLQPLLGTYLANYANFKDEEFEVSFSNGKLFLDIPSQMEFELLEPDENGKRPFAVAPEKIKVAFNRNDENEVVGLTIYQDGKGSQVPRAGTNRVNEMSEEKTADDKKKSKEQLQAAWLGKLEMGELNPVMQFRIVTTESGDTAAYFDSINEGLTGFDATWSIDGAQLKFDVAKIGLKYRGTLNEARDSAEGTWSQGGREFPLSLNKQDKAYEK